ncbi:MAG: uncharacterized protein KVP18_001372 [Porospora cf. gigantea A]|uniref:uncharacterized protein n=1 Tax=Porospora cf. gigantea A TaxID=2853593 RepID=UPI00355A1A1E|nr:MAG: hypothetical protein KVP18_001372 [Porospora cf. gigantea A]
MFEAVTDTGSTPMSVASTSVHMELLVLCVVAVQVGSEVAVQLVMLEEPRVHTDSEVNKEDLL